MKLAETVTFGGSGLDRAAELRASDIASSAGRSVLVLWRGKPLATEQGLCWLAPGHPLLAAASGTEVFLGLHDGEVRCAADLPEWQPGGQDAAVVGTFLDASAQVHPDSPDGAAFRELRTIMTSLSAADAELAATARALLGWHRTHGFCAACGAPSTVTMSGWQRTCGACGTSHFPRTDPVVIMLVTHGNSVLLGRSQGWPEGMYSLLAGFVEPGETIEAAVRREVFEEAGVRIGAVGYLASQPWPFPSSLMIGCRGEALGRDLRLDPTEIEDALWLTREELALVFTGRHPRIRAPRRGAIAGFLLQNWLADRLD